MENSTSQTPVSGVVDDGGNDTEKSYENTVFCFGSLRLAEDETLQGMKEPSFLHTENASTAADDASTSSSSSCPSKNAALVQEPAQKNVALVQEAEQNLSSVQEDIWAADARTRTSSIPQENIWAANPLFFCNWGNTQVENHCFGEESPVGYASYTDKRLDFAPANLYGSLIGNPSMYNSENIFDRVSVPNYLPDVYHAENGVMNGFACFNPVMEYEFVKDQLNGGYCMNNNMASSSLLQYQNLLVFGKPEIQSFFPGIDFVMMSKDRNSSEQLQRILQKGDPSYRQAILNGVFGSIFELMIDENGHYVFGKLIEKCDDNQLSVIVLKMIEEKDSFIAAAFCEKGSKSIQRFIKRLKKNPMVLIITRTLATRSYELLTHKTGSHVIRQCFVLLGDKPNQVLYEEILSHFRALATDPVGCISINNCIDNISGLQRAVLLNYVADNSLFLSNDPSGNFVVQHVIDLDNQDLTLRIFYNLKGKYVQLAQKQGGSHVVEKCIRSSPLGLTLVVAELLSDHKALFLLAADQFGNYVIQKALERAKIHDNYLYEALVKALEPYYPILLRKKRGRHVTELIKGDLDRSRAKSDQ